MPKTKSARKPQRRLANRKAARRPAPKRTRRAVRAPKPQAPVYSPSGVTVQHMDYCTRSLEEVKRFYTEKLGFSRFQFDPRFNYLAIETGPSSSLGFMPPMPGMPEMSPREPTIYLMVKDVDAAYERLVARGVAFDGPPQDMPWGHRVIKVCDPEGRMVMLAQPPKG